MSATTATSTTAGSTATPGSNRRFIKRPDNKAQTAKVEEIRSQIKEKDSSIEKLTSQLQSIKLSGPVAEERKTLKKQLGELVQQRSEIKQQREVVQNQISAIDSQLKRKINDLNSQTSKNNYKNVEEIDKKIDQLDKLVDSGSLKLVEERKTIKEMSALRKLKKDFAQIEVQQSAIDQDKAKIAELKKKLGSIQNKELQAKFESISKRLDEINQDNESVSNKRNEIFNKRSALYKEKDSLYDSLKKTRQEFDQEFSKFKKAMEEEKLRRSQEDKLYKLSKEKEELVQDADLKLKNARIPAFTAEIDTIYNLLQQFDPTFIRPSATTSSNNIFSASSNNTLNKQPKRTIEMPEDSQIIRKEPENFFNATSNKSKKNKRNGGASKQKFSIEPNVIVSLGELGIALPSSQEDVEATKKSLFEKLDEFKSKQEDQTKINIEKAEANKKAVDEKIAKLEQKIMNDTTGSGSSSPTPKPESEETENPESES